MVEMEIHQWMIDVEGRLTVWVKTPIEVSKPFTKKEPHSLWGGNRGATRTVGNPFNPQRISA